MEGCKSEEAGGFSKSKSERSEMCHKAHNAKYAIRENNGLTIGEQKNASQYFENTLLTEFHDMLTSCSSVVSPLFSNIADFAT